MSSWRATKLTLTRWLWGAGLLALVVQFPLLGYFALRPIAFQWTNVIRPGVIPELHAGTSQFLDVRAVISRIPYDSLAQVYAINPPDRYQRTIIEGNGNCSNFVNGLAYLLVNEEIPFQIVHFFEIDGFLTGVGHSVINAAYELNDQKRIGIVDVAEGGIPMTGSRYLTVADLQTHGLASVSIAPLGARQGDASQYYGSFLDRSVIGVVDGTATAAYFHRLEQAYVPLGAPRLETYLYRGIAIILGLYPRITVTPADYQRLFAGHQAVRIAGRSLTVLLRLDCAVAALALMLLLNRLLFTARVRQPSVMMR